MTQVLEINISRKIGGFTLEAAFDMPPGCTVLFGPSGSGKSMLLDCIAGLVNPQMGSITLKDRPLFNTLTRTNVPPESRQIGYVFQQPRLFPHLTVEQNIYYSHRFQKGESLGKSNQAILEMLGIEDLLDRRPHFLSGGEQQRVSIARALVSRPELLLMDEPLASLDPPRRQEILPFIERLNQEAGIPILYVTHSLNEAVRLAHLIVLLDKGEVVAKGQAEEVLNRDDLRHVLGRTDSELFAGEPATIFQGRVAEHDLAFGLTRLVSHGLNFWVPATSRPIGSDLRLRILAQDVAIATQKLEKSSILNQLYVTIEQIHEIDNGTLELILQANDDIRIKARITRRSLARLNLAPGQKAVALVKSVAIIM